MKVRNPSRLAARPLAPYAPADELALNMGRAPKMTLDQLERGVGIHAAHVPPGTPEVVPHPEMTFVGPQGERLSFAEVSKAMASFLEAAAAMAQPFEAHFPANEEGALNPVESAIAYRRNADGLSPVPSTAALETDLVKFSVLGFQIGSDRDRRTMAKLDQVCGELTRGLQRNRDLRSSRAEFELGLRGLPQGLPYLVVAGVREAIDYVYNELEFNEEVIQFLKHEVPATKGWTDEQWNYLRGFKDELSKLEISGLPDGSIYTGGPILKVSGPPLICELIETAVMARVTSMSAKATAVAQVKEIFEGFFAELGMRRPPSADSKTKDIEACNVVADVATSNVYAQFLAGVRAVGTMEHSAIMLNGTEAETLFFVQWFLLYGELSSALVDSRSPKEGVQAVIQAQQIIDALRPELEKDPAYAHLKDSGFQIPSIRLDSGDLRAQVQQFRKMLDDAGMQTTKITIMDGMDHEKLKRVLRGEDGEQVQVDGMGSGGAMRFPVAIDDQGRSYRPQLGMIYKASRLFHGDDTLDLMKLSASAGKATRPSRAVHRILDAEGKMVKDVATLVRGDGTVVPPRAPRGGRVEERLQVLAREGAPSPEFQLDLQDYWSSTRARFAEEAAALPLSWDERDAARAEGRIWRPVYEESAVLRQTAERIRESGRTESPVTHAP